MTLIRTRRAWSLEAAGFHLCIGWGSAANVIIGLQRHAVNGLRLNVGPPFVVICWPA